VNLKKIHKRSFFSHTTSMKIQIIKEKIDKESKEHVQITLENQIGFCATFYSLGAMVSSLYNQGEPPFTLDYPQSEINRDTSFLGKTCGRFAGRIKQNETITLHGGKNGISRKNFDLEKIEEQEKSTKVIFQLLDKGDGSEGDFILRVEYVFYEQERKLEIYYSGFATKDTYLSLTNHLAFETNLDKENTLLQLDCPYYYELDSDYLPIQKEKAKGEFDFRKMRKVRLYLNSLRLQKTKGYDHPFERKRRNLKKPIAILYLPKRKYEVKVFTTYPVLVFYTLNQDSYFPQHSGLCLECSYLPNEKEWKKGKKVLSFYPKNKLYKEVIIYEFHDDSSHKQMEMENNKEEGNG
jgi:galactose mutarotase-like enzyme